MELLKKAYEARSKKVNKVEKVKDLKNPMEAFERIFPLNCMQTSYFRDLLKNWCLHFEKSLFSGL